MAVFYLFLCSFSCLSDVEKSVCISDVSTLQITAVHQAKLTVPINTGNPKQIKNTTLSKLKMDLNVYSFLTLPLLSSRFAKPRLTLL
jgi:hypothetical protein